MGRAPGHIYTLGGRGLSGAGDGNLSGAETQYDDGMVTAPCAPDTPMIIIYSMLVSVDNIMMKDIIPL